MFKKLCSFFKSCCVSDQEVAPVKPSKAEEKSVPAVKAEKPKPAVIKKIETNKQETKAPVKKKTMAKKRTPKNKK